MLSQTGNSGPQETESTGNSFLDVLNSAYNSKTFLIIQIIIVIYCLILIFNIVYTSIQLSLFRGRMRQFLTGAKAKPQKYELLSEMPGTVQVLEINKKLISESPSDWKIAIIEADKTLDMTLEKKGFAGKTLGERLKEMVPADLPEVYEEVWEAHKIRNRIVHEPDYEVSQTEARKVVGIYERAIRKLM
jgi:hypothetical protein